MKSRIGKLEGDGRTAKRLHESLEKHVKLLEHALKRERDKSKKAQAGEAGGEEKTHSDNSKDKSADTKRRSPIYCRSRKRSLTYE